MTDMTPAQTPMETHMTVVKALLRCGGRMTIDSLPGDASMAAYNIPADVQEALAAALDLLTKRDAELARVRRLIKTADFIEDQVKVTRAYANDTDMGRNNVSLMETCTSHFLDAAREIRAALTPEPEGDAG